MGQVENFSTMIEKLKINKDCLFSRETVIEEFS